MSNPTQRFPCRIWKSKSSADRNAVDWGYRDGECLDAVCKHVGLDIEYSHYPNEILLEVPLDGQACGLAAAERPDRAMTGSRLPRRSDTGRSMSGRPAGHTRAAAFRRSMSRPRPSASEGGRGLRHGVSDAEGRIHGGLARRAVAGGIEPLRCPHENGLSARRNARSGDDRLSRVVADRDAGPWPLDRTGAALPCAGAVPVVDAGSSAPDTLTAPALI
jgi:hypothetical protein